jgi:hypothetical protein
MSQPVSVANAPVETGVKETAPTTNPESGSQETPPQNDSGKLSYEQMEAELKRVRQEAASRRIALREQEEAAKKWSEYEESQKSELQKLQDRLAEKDKAIAEKELEVSRAKIAKQFNVADEDLDLLVGDEENMKRLAERLGKKEDAPTSPGNLLAGNRGKPIGNSGNTFSMEDFIRGSVR